MPGDLANSAQPLDLGHQLQRSGTFGQSALEGDERACALDTGEVQCIGEIESGIE